MGRAPAHDLGAARMGMISSAASPALGLEASLCCW